MLILKNKNNTIPQNLKLKLNISDYPYASSTLDNSFSLFKSINNIFYLIFYSINNTIVSYNLESLQIISEIRSENISNFRHFLDKLNKRDLLLSISFRNNNLFIFDILNFECILKISKVNNIGWLYSACIFTENNQNYIITNNYSLESNPDALKIFDFNGNKIKEMKNSDENSYFIDTYYDKVLLKNYIVVGNAGYVKSYDFLKNELYHKYYDNSNKSHPSIVINDNDIIIKLIESSNDGNIRIWNFHTGQLLDKINTGDEYLTGICLWDNNYLFVACGDGGEGTIKLIDLNKKAIINIQSNYSDEVLTIKKIILHDNIDYLISQSLGKEGINIWKIEN